MTKLRKMLALVACSLTMAPLAHAAWPDDKPIEIVVGFAAGGETDIMARGLAPFIQKHLGGKANIVVINKVGAAGEIANAHVQRQPADGYTVGVVNVPPLQFIPMTRKAQYDPANFALIARVVSDPTLLVTRDSSPYRNLTQVIQALKDKPNSLAFGFNGTGSNGHLAMLQLKRATNVELNDIPFNGTAVSKTALLGGHIDFMFTSLTAVPSPEKESVPLRVVTQFMDSRVPALSQVPTALEEKISVVMPSERGFALHRNVPGDIRNRLEKAIELGLRDPEFLKSASSYASVISFLPGAQWQKALDANASTLKELARTMPATQ